MNALKEYAKAYTKAKALAKVMEALKESALRELRRKPDGKTSILGVEFHVTNKTTRRYPKDVQDILKNLQEQIEQQKKVAEEASKVKITSTETFDASIPKSQEEDILSGIPEYRRHFGK